MSFEAWWKKFWKANQNTDWKSGYVDCWDTATLAERERCEKLRIEIERLLYALLQIRDLAQNNTGQTYSAMARAAIDAYEQEQKTHTLK